MKNGLTYFWCAGVAVFLSWALSGCYIGNKEVDAPFNGPWFYETQIGNLQLCAAKNGQAANCTNQINNEYLPQFYIPLASGISLDFSNLADPVIFSQLDPTTAGAVGASYSVTNSDSGSLAFIVNANGSATSPISYDATTQVEVFHDVSNNNAATCVMDTTNAGPYTTYTANPLSGRMIFTATITMTPDPVINTDCAQAILCYNDPVDANANNCKGVSFNEVGAIFQDFTATQVLDLSAVNGVYPTVNSLSYTIQYQ
jgi:hypothetical protein